MRVIGKAGVIVEFGGLDGGAHVVRQLREHRRELLARPGVIDKVAQDQLFALSAQHTPDLAQALLPAGSLKRGRGQAQNKTAEVRQRG